jgi:hypothetical protein
VPRRGAVVLPLVALVVAAQIAVPAWGLFKEPARFGWQMYAGNNAGNSTAIELTLVYASGERRSPSLRALDLMGHYRGEVAYERHIPPFLCARDPGLRLVVVETERSSVHRRHRCSTA